MKQWVKQLLCRHRWSRWWFSESMYSKHKKNYDKRRCHTCGKVQTKRRYFG